MSIFTKRLEEIRHLMEEKRFDALYISPGPNLFYLTGFATESFERLTCCIISPETEPVLIVPKLDEEKAKKVSHTKNIRSYLDTDNTLDVLNRIFTELGLLKGKIGVEDKLWFKWYQQLQKISPQLQFENSSDIYHFMRIKKSQEEINFHKKAVEIVEKGITVGAETIQEGITESEVVFEIRRAMKKEGAESIPFCVVLAGPNSALPHGTPSDTPIKKGDIVQMDMSCTYRGYFGDISRVAILGKMTEKQEKIYDIVLKATKDAVAAVRAGVEAQFIDKVARTVIENAGYGEYFIHRTGHGLGLEVHEKPYIREGNRMILEPGMVFTIEPGIYFPGEFGIRIEENVAVTKDDVIVLSTLSRDEPLPA